MKSKAEAPANKIERTPSGRRKAGSPRGIGGRKPKDRNAVSKRMVTFDAEQLEQLDALVEAVQAKGKKAFNRSLLIGRLLKAQLQIGKDLDPKARRTALTARVMDLSGPMERPKKIVAARGRR